MPSGSFKPPYLMLICACRIPLGGGGTKSQGRSPNWTEYFQALARQLTPQAHLRVTVWWSRRYFRDIRAAAGSGQGGGCHHGDAVVYFLLARRRHRLERSGFVCVLR